MRAGSKWGRKVTSYTPPTEFIKKTK